MEERCVSGGQAGPVEVERCQSGGQAGPVEVERCLSGGQAGPVELLGSVECQCDDCLLEITDYDRERPARAEGGRRQLYQLVRQEEEHEHTSSIKPSGWRKIRNIVHWSPFIQQYKNVKYKWVQLAGHQGCFQPGEIQGTILKKLCPREQECLVQLMDDQLKLFVPEYKGEVYKDGEKYIIIQDLLCDFHNPNVMDTKMGVRTYLEEELKKAKENPKWRKDLYDKMYAIDPKEPSAEERECEGITKPRYMMWRETISSSASLGFRIEGIKKGEGFTSKDFKNTRTRDQVSAAFQTFTDKNELIVSKYIRRLKAIRSCLEESQFFNSHELIGSSLLFVHDECNASVWLIDFAKTHPLPEGVSINHRNPWFQGNHEDGYLYGVDCLISILEAMIKKI